jgi:uncharacterized protein (TIGR02246 family)
VTDQPEADALQRLLDIEEIKQLKARYFRTLDHKDWDGFASVFAADAVLEVPEANLLERGRVAIVDAVRTPLRGTRTVHHGHMPEIEVIGPDSARGTWAMFDYVEWDRPDGGGRAGLKGYGHYVEEYVREGGEWRIARCHLARLRVDALESDGQA